MTKLPWDKVDRGWTKLVLKRRKASREHLREILEYCESELSGDGQFMYYVVEYNVYIVLKISDPDQAMIFRVGFM